MSTIFEEAEALVSGVRREKYGHPLDNHSATATMWRTYLERKFGHTIDLSAEDVCWLNVLQKIVREANSEQHDNLVDVAGFTRNVELVQEERVVRSAPKARFNNLYIGSLGATPNSVTTGIVSPPSVFHRGNSEGL